MGLVLLWPGAVRADIAQFTGDGDEVLLENWVREPPHGAFASDESGIGPDASTDLRMAQTLQAHGWRGSFAWPLVPMNRAMADVEEILATGMEICSHSTSHIDMTTLSENRMFWELASSLVFLGALTDLPVAAYGNPYLSRNTDTDEEFYQSGLLLGRWGGSIGRFSILDFDERHVCSAVKCGAVQGVVERIDDMIDNGAPGDVLMMWGHVRDNDGWDEARWTEFEQMLTDYGGRSDAWYATCREVGSYMFLRNGSFLGGAEIGADTVAYPLHIGAMPRDVVDIPVTLRVSGAQSLLDKVVSITVDGETVPFTTGSGLLTFDVDPFLQDLYPRRITSDILDSAHPTIQLRAAELSGEPPPDLDATWLLTRHGDVFDVEVSITNNGALAAESFSFAIACSTLWEVTGEVNVPTRLAPSQTFQNSYAISLKPSVNADGWTGFYGRIDYVLNGAPRTHFLWHDVEWPPSQ
jgi:peptidoglycan/xylan/chitin deacetylase (PgdA/CDA1 family)